MNDPVHDDADEAHCFKVGENWIMSEARYPPTIESVTSAELHEVAPGAYTVTAGAQHPEPWSHQWHDLLGLRYHQAIAERILERPALLQVAKENLRRWIESDGVMPPSDARTEWLKILAAKNLTEIISIMMDPSEEGHRRRQSTPFAGILTRDERRIIRDQLLR